MPVFKRSLALLSLLWMTDARSDDLTGLVVDTKGAPVPLASVAVMEHDSQAEYVVHTDEEGRFHIPMNGEQSVHGVRPEILLAWSGKNAMSYPLDVKTGEPLTLRLLTEGFARLEGRVVDEQGQPIADAVVEWLMNFDYMTGAGPIPKEQLTDAQGRFTFPRFWPAGDDFILFVHARGYGGAAFRDERIEAGKTKTFQATLRKADQALSGVVVDSTGQPVPGVPVSIDDDEQPDGLRAKTDASGAFRFNHVCAGEVYVRAWQATKAMRRETHVTATIPGEPVRLVLPDNKGEISGVLLNAAGKPLADVEVSDWETASSARSDAQGHFHLTGLRNGWRTLSAKVIAADGTQVEHRARFKTGSTEARFQLPEKPRPEQYLTSTPRDLTGQPSPELHMDHWINSPPLASKAGGKVRILDFWGLQCAPCIASLPKVQAFWSQHSEKVEVIASLDFYPLEEVKEFLLKHADWTFPIALESQDSTAMMDYDVRGVPTYIVSDKEGRIQLSTHEWPEAEDAALKLLGGK